MIELNHQCDAGIRVKMIGPRNCRDAQSAPPLSELSQRFRRSAKGHVVGDFQGDPATSTDIRYDVALSDNAVCHRNLNLGDSQCVFISTRLMDDKFSVAFEFYINVGHALVERAGVSAEFSELAWSQVEAGVRGETSLDAWEARKLATASGSDSERYKNEYLEATFSDTISIYLLSLYLDVDYYDLRERDYPLLAPSALAERLRKVAELFPPNTGFEFAVLYKRRG